MTTEDLRAGEVRHTHSCCSTMVALDADRRPVAVPPLALATDDQRRRHAAAVLRRDLRREVEARTEEIRTAIPWQPSPSVRRMDEIAEAFYLPLGEGRFAPTRATESPWDVGAQHGGPPSALLAHLAAAAGGQQPARVSVDFFGAIPRTELTVEVSPVRPGRRIDLTEAVMTAGGRTVAVARVWSLAPGPTPPVVTPSDAPPPVPADGTVVFPDLPDFGYQYALDWRYTAGSPEQPGAADVWTRVRIPLVAGEELTGTDRTLIAADAANGISVELPIEGWLSIPPGMTTHLVREAEGEWVHLACRTRIGDNGLGLCTGTISDARGVYGEVTQPLLVRAR